jgi:electron transfer flavoprotein alpha subunit
MLSSKEIKNIILVVEEGAEGLADISRQLVTAGLKYKTEWGSHIFAFLPADTNGSNATALAKSGPDVVYQTDDTLMKKHPHEASMACLIQLINKVKADVVLFGASELGTDMAARAAARLETGLLQEIIDLELDPEDGNLVGVFMGFEGQLICKAKFGLSKPVIATVKPKVFAPAVETDSAGGVEKVKLPQDRGKFKISITQSLEPVDDMPDLESAEVVIAGGRGVGGKEGFAMLEDLARLLGGAVGCTLPPVEQGWMDRDLMIGSTGKTVRPKVYIGCGIHGDVYHTSGMDESERIVVINDNDKAPFFDLATCGLLGDLREIIPHLIKKIRDEVKNF